MTDYAAEFETTNQPSAVKDYARDFETIESKPVEAPKVENKPVRSAFGAANPIGELTANVVTGLGSAMVGGWHGIYKLASGQGLDAAAEAVRGDQAKMTYQPEPGTAGAKAVEGFQSGYNPLNWPALASHWAGEKVFEGTGSPIAGVATELAGNLAPLGLLGKASKEVPKPRVEPRPFDIEVTGTNAPQPIPMGAVSSLVESAAEARPQIQTKPIPSATGGPQVRVQVPTFAEIDPAEAATSVSPAQVTKRSELLERVGVPKELQRNSAVEGNLQAAADDFRSKLVTNAQGEFWRDQFDKERTALTNHAESISQGTGGTIALDESARYGQGTRILEPLEAVRDHFNGQIKQLYQAADERAGGAAVANLDALQEMLGKDSMFAGKSANGSLRRGIRAYMKEQNIVSKDGTLNPITVEQAEGLRQYINSQYSHETSGLAGILKDAIDNDVTKAAGDDIYAQARAMRAARAAVIDNPKGISQLLQSDPNAPMNRAVPLEKIPERITQMPVDQISHIMQVLKTVPDELKPQAQQAIAEIQASFSNKALDLGSKRAPGEPWGATDVSKFLRDNKEKIAVVFKDRPDLMAKMQDLNDAGLVLAPKTAYRGAPAEAHNLLQRGAVSMITPATTSVGTFLGGAPGAVAGAFVGNKLTGKAADKIALKNAQKRVGTSRLADIEPE